MTKQEEFNQAVKDNDIKNVKLLLNDSMVDPSAADNYAIRWASYKGQLDVVKLLLNDPRVDPSDSNNQAIRVASDQGHIDVVKLLWKNKKIKDSFKMDDSALSHYLNRLNVNDKLDLF